MHRVIVSKRFGEWVDVRDFVRPNDYMVSAVVKSRPSWTVRDLWQWVMEHIRYPSGGLFSLDRHVLYSYGKRYVSIDYWSYPSETLQARVGDCEDSAILLTSMLRRAGYSAFATVGFYKDFGHVWVSMRRDGAWLVLDTTLSSVPPVVPTEALAREYKPLFRFNEEEVLIEAAEVLVSRRDSGPRWYMIVDE